jgi:hypothetical protein
MRWEHDELITRDGDRRAAQAQSSDDPQRDRRRKDPPCSRGKRRVRVWRSDLQTFLEDGATIKRPAPAELVGSVWDGVIPTPVRPDEHDS